MSRNFLDQETSPYLLQHKDNPVHWRAWSPETLAHAVREDKIIVLSVGYAACHWCHVMAHESFENETIAAIINRSFIPIKVDREERPDIDSFYQTALALSGEQGGWPLTLFLLPDGRPFAGGTYFPPTSRYGRPGFGDVLNYVASLYPAKKDEIVQQAEALGEGLKTVLLPPVSSKTVPLVVLAATASRLILERMDMEDGGLRGAPKFPQPTLLGFLWHHALRLARQEESHQQAEQAVLLTLRRMGQGGIYDQIGGGFCRYSTDSRWLVPHFEKMLYDNAQLLLLLSSAWQRTHEPFFQRKATETIDWLCRDMLTPEGMFAASLDADSVGGEGAFYVWDEREIDEVLGPRAAAFKKVYGVSAAGNWEGKNILTERRDLSDDVIETFAMDRSLLRKARALRPPVGRDDKILADWNAMTIRALAYGAFVFDRPDWLRLAESVFLAVRSSLEVPEGRLAHAFRLGKQSGPAMLDDYAHLGLAALELYQRLGSADYLAQAEVWAESVERLYLDEENGAYFMTASDALDVPARLRPRFDSAVPSGNSAMASFLVTLFLLTGKDVYRERLERLLAALRGAIMAEPLGLVGFLDAVQMMENPCQIVLVGLPGTDAYQELERTLAALPLVDTVLQSCLPELPLSPEHPAFGKKMVDGKPTVYICSDFRCSPPLTKSDTLSSFFNRK